MIPRINITLLKAARNSIRNATINNACEIDKGFAQGFDQGFQAGVEFVMEYAKQLDAEAAVAPAEMSRAQMYRKSDDAILDRKSLA
jgi:hypothetical protein